jgi:hypothetical protein
VLRAKSPFPGRNLGHSRIVNFDHPTTASLASPYTAQRQKRAASMHSNQQKAKQHHSDCACSTGNVMLHLVGSAVRIAHHQEPHVFAHLMWLVAWLSCLPCHTWCNIIITCLDTVGNDNCILTTVPANEPRRACIRHISTQVAILWPRCQRCGLLKRQADPNAMSRACLALWAVGILAISAPLHVVGQGKWWHGD